MKRLLITCVSIILIILTVHNLSAQTVIDVKKANALRTAKITGRITYPKTINVGNNFKDKVQSKLTAYSFELNNGTVTNKKFITPSTVNVVNYTSASSANYEYVFEITLVVPFDKPIELGINDWCYSGCGGLGGTHIIFNKKNANEFATFTINDKLHEGFDFTAESKEIPY